MLRKFKKNEIEKIQDSFVNAFPFPHVVIDNFLDEDFAEKLLKDFPPFIKSHSKNEFGNVGEKCVYSNIEKISESYSDFYDFINSNSFLSQVSRLTGINDLIPDPYLFGAGTHENIEGAELDCHIDFNYDGKGNHRRLNLLIYLNKERDSEWGGAIELHKDPFGWIDNTDKIVTTNCIFNRCVIFATSEVSWHGFKRIKLPENKKHLSRKLISIYLYTKDRPKEQIAPSHGTFYIPYIPDFNGGDVIDFKSESKRLIHKRDSLLKLAWQTELRLSRDNHLLRAHIQNIQKAIQPTVCGNAIVKKNSVRNYYHDQWIGPDFVLTIEPLDVIDTLEVQGWSSSSESKKLNIVIDKNLFSIEVHEGVFVHEFKIRRTSEPFEIEIKGSPNEAHGNDKRELVVILKYIKVT